MNDGDGQDPTALKEPLLPPPVDTTELDARVVLVDEEATPPVLSSNLLDKRTSSPPPPLSDGGQEAMEGAFQATTSEEEAASLPLIPLEPAPESMQEQFVESPYYRDKYFAVAFLLQVTAVLLTAVILGPKAVASLVSDSDKDDDTTNSTTIMDLESSLLEATDDEDEDTNVNGTAVIALLALTPVLAIVLTLGALRLLVSQSTSRNIVTLSFFAVPISWWLAALFFDAVGTVDRANQDDNDDVNPTGGFYGMALLATGTSLCLYCCYRRYIPLAAANLKVALVAVQSHIGSLLCLSLATLLAMYIWMVAWGLALLGVFYQAQEHGDKVPCDDDNYKTMMDGNDPDDDDMQLCDAQPNPLILFLLLVSFYWTHQVLKNILHTTTAGTVGSWWFSPSPQGSSGVCCCTVDVRDSWIRATTYSLGSICFGSLVVAALQTLEALTQGNRRNGRRGGCGSGMLGCVAHCLLHCLRRWMEYLNSWAFCYVGLYGYDFMTSGKKVMTLFQYRGWTAIVTDRLVFRVLGLVNFSIGILTGCAAAASDVLLGPMVPDTPGTSYVIAFLVGLLLGTLISGTALFVVESAVRTIIVCFAADPAGLANHHPDLYANMTTGWTKVYPDIFDRRNVQTPQQQQQSQGDDTDIPEATLLVSS